MKQVQYEMFITSRNSYMSLAGTIVLGRWLSFHTLYNKTRLFVANQLPSSFLPSRGPVTMTLNTGVS